VPHSLGTHRRAHGLPEKPIDDGIRLCLQHGFELLRARSERLLARRSALGSLRDQCEESWMHRRRGGLHNYIHSIRRYTQTYIRIHACIHKYIHQHTHMCVCACICVCTYIHAYVFTYIHTIRRYKRTCIRIHACMHAYIHTYIHTYMYILV